MVAQKIYKQKTRKEKQLN